MSDDLPPRDDMRYIVNAVITDGSDLLADLQAAQYRLRQEDLLARLGNMLADLDGHIERRAATLAQPLIDDAREAAAAEVSGARGMQQRAEDLVTELHRQYAVLERRRAEQQQRAEDLDAAIARVRRLCDLTIAASCRVQAVEQARDTLAALDGQEPGRG